MVDNERPHVVILGGGFGGLYCARSLARAPVRITLIDSRNFHLFQPLLYQVATASLSPSDIASPIRHIVRRQRNVQVWLGEAVEVDTAAKRVRLRDAEVSYDYLVVATGVRHAYFGHPEWAARAPGLKTIEDATEIRRRFLMAYEAAEREADPDTRHALLTFIIVGAGPTGVELAGAMAEIARDVMPRDFRAIDTAATRIILMEGAPRVLPTYHEISSERAHRQLTSLGVEVRTGALVTDIRDSEVVIGADEIIRTGNVFWAAGVQASDLGASLGAPLDRVGRVHVEPDLTLPGDRSVFVIGDLASLEESGRPVPGVAPAAMQMGRHAAAMIRRDIEHKPREPFRYFDKGSLATVGRAAAVAEFGRLRLSGFIAWFVWVFVHIMYLIGFRNRIVVLIQWAWSWLLYQRGTRLITGDSSVRLREVREPVAEEATDGAEQPETEPVSAH